jgi:hypothetical protein
MNRKLVIALAAATAFTTSIAGALAQSAPKQAPPGVAAAPLSPTLTRIGKPAAAPASPLPGAGFSALTAEECKKLGGSVYTAPQCKKTGTRCVMRLEGGQVNAPCIDEVS